MSTNNIFLTSDMHFGHANIIKYCNRPFANVVEQEEKLIENWNGVCDSNSRVFHLGDFAWKLDAAHVDSIVRRLKFRELTFIKGNHEKPLTQFMHNYGHKYNVELVDYFELRHSNMLHVLFHYPMLSWNAKHHGSFHFYGHVHGNETAPGRCYEVGVDLNDYKPISLWRAQDKALANENRT